MLSVTFPIQPQKVPKETDWMNNKPISVRSPDANGRKSPDKKNLVDKNPFIKR